MGYTVAQKSAAVSALVAAIHGIHPDVANAWATAEQGAFYNILGVTYNNATGQHLFRFTSWTQGAEAAAHLIATGPYGGIRSAVKLGSSQQQAAAIIASPWNHPYYSTGAGAALLRSVAGTIQHTPTGNPHVRVLGRFQTYTFRGNVLMGATPRDEPIGTIIQVNPNETRDYASMKLVMVRAGKYLNLFVNPHGMLAYSE
jgi:hypothetical protein